MKSITIKLVVQPRDETDDCYEVGQQILRDACAHAQVSTGDIIGVEDAEESPPST